MANDERETQIASMVEELTSLEKKLDRGLSSNRLDKIKQEVEKARKLRAEKKVNNGDQKDQKVLKFGTLRKKATQDEDVGEWKEAKAPSGKVYYFHTKTKQTSWTKPTELTEAETPTLQGGSSTDELLSMTEEKKNSRPSTPTKETEENKGETVVQQQNPPTLIQEQRRGSGDEQPKYESTGLRRASSGEGNQAIKQGDINFIASVKLSSNAKGLQLNSVIQSVIFKIAVAKRLNTSCTRSLINENKRKMLQMGSIQRDLTEIAELLKEIPEMCYLEDMLPEVKKTYHKLTSAVSKMKEIVGKGTQETDNTAMPAHFKEFADHGLDILHITLDLLKLNDEIFQNDIIDMCRNILLILKGCRDASSLHQIPQLVSESTNYNRMLSEMVLERAEMLDDIEIHEKLVSASTTISEAIPELMSLTKAIIQASSPEVQEKRNVILKSITVAISEIIKSVKVSPKFQIDTS